MHAPEDWWDDWPAHLEGSDSADVERWLSEPSMWDRKYPVREGERETWTRERWLEGWRGPGTEGGRKTGTKTRVSTQKTPPIPFHAPALASSN